MERTRSPSRTVVSYFRIPNSILLPPPSKKVPEKHTPGTLNHSLQRNDCRDKRHAIQGHNYSGQTHRLRIHFPHVLAQENQRKNASNLQPQKLKPISKITQIPPNQPHPSPKFPPGRGLSMYNRPLRCLLSCPSEKIPPEIPLVPLQRKNVLMEMPSLRPGIGPPSLQSTHQLGGGSPSKTRTSNHRLLRRFPTGCSILRRASHENQIDSVSFADFGLADQSVQISSRSIAYKNLPRPGLEYHIPKRVTSRRQNPKLAEPNFPPSKKTALVTSLLPKTSGPTKLRGLCDPTGTTSLATLPTSCSYVTEALSPQTFTHPPCRSRNTEMVENTPKRKEVSATLKRQNHPLDRCFGLGTGNLHRGGHSSTTGMERSTTLLAYKQTRVVRGILGDINQPTSVQESVNNSPNRQQGCCGPNSESRRSQISNPSEGDLEITSPCQLSSSPNNAPLHSKSFQFHRRLSIPQQPSAGVAFDQNRPRTRLPTLGNTLDRPICVPVLKDSKKLRDDGPSRSQCSVRKRLLSTLDLQTGVGLSSPSPDTASPGSLEQSIGDVLDCGTEMDQDILASRPQSSSRRRTHQIEEPRSEPSRPLNHESPTKGKRHPAGGMESTGWATHISEWNAAEKMLLNAAWRPSTKSTYRQPWQRWATWAKNKGINHLRPAPEMVARFLAFLHSELRLAPSSISLHKSVIATWIDPDLALTITTHPLVRKMLKGISASQPRKESRRIWNINQLKDWVEQNPPCTSSFFAVTRHVALLLALASGRRIHDLTLLHIDSDHFQLVDNEIIFWPQYGSKTDNSSRTQSGWRITNNVEELWDPIKWINILLDLRKKRCGALPLTHLFISSRGKVKPASRATIAKWVSTALSSAGITAAPGSIRSAVGSELAHSNFNIDAILDRANWRSATTFLKHYYRPILPTPTSTSNNPMTSSFMPTN